MHCFSDQPHLTVKDKVGFAVAIAVVLLGVIGIVIVCTLQEKSDFEVSNAQIWS